MLTDTKQTKKKKFSPLFFNLALIFSTLLFKTTLFNFIIFQALETEGVTSP